MLLLQTQFAPPLNKTEKTKWARQQLIIWSAAVGSISASKTVILDWGIKDVTKQGT